MKDFLPRTHFNEEHEMFRDMVRGFVEKEITPNVERWHNEGMPDREVFQKAGALGLIGMSTPEEYGGGGEMDFRYNQVLNEELTQADCGSIVVSFGTLNDLVAPYLAKFASEELKQKYLAPMNASRWSRRSPTRRRAAPACPCSWSTRPSRATPRPAR